MMNVEEYLKQLYIFPLVGYDEGVIIETYSYDNDNNLIILKGTGLKTKDKYVIKAKIVPAKVYVTGYDLEPYEIKQSIN